MSAFPSAEAERAAVTRFLTMIDRLDPPMTPLLETAQDQAEAFRTRLETPVRIAFAGKTGAGKSSLVNLLVGDQVLPRDRVLPTIVVRHAAVDCTIAHWWDRPSQSFPGRAFDAASALDPDFIALEIDCEALDGLSLVHVSGFDDAESSKRAVFALMRLADVMLWCSRADNPTIKAESDSWKLIPGRLIRNSMLILTHAEEISESGIQAAKDMLTPDRLNNFRDVIAISTQVAQLALENPGEDFEELWQVSGAAHLVEAVIGAAVEVREGEIERIRRGLAQFVAPAQAELDRLDPAPPPPAPAVRAAEASPPPPAAAPVRPAEPVAPPPAPAPAVASPAQVTTEWRRWQEAVRGLRGQVGKGAVPSDADFVMAVQGLVDAFQEVLAGTAERSAMLDWLGAEFEHANDLLILLQFETSDSAATDAARILLQLTDAVAEVFAGTRA